MGTPTVRHKYLELFSSVRAWANARNIITESTVKAQYVKLMEEWKEIEDDAIDGIGDSIVVLTIIAAQVGINLEEHDPLLTHKTELHHLGELAQCLNKGYDPIKQLQHLMYLLMVKATNQGLNVYECLTHAYLEIRDRTGIMLKGTWVKTSDLTEAEITDVLPEGTPLPEDEVQDPNAPAIYRVHAVYTPKGTSTLDSVSIYQDYQTQEEADASLNPEGVAKLKESAPKGTTLTLTRTERITEGPILAALLDKSTP